MFRQRDIVEVEVGIIHGQEGMLGRAQDHRGERTVRAEPWGRSPLQEQEEEEGSVKKRQSSELRGELGRQSQAPEGFQERREFHQHQVWPTFSRERDGRAQEAERSGWGGSEWGGLVFKSG